MSGSIKFVLLGNITTEMQAQNLIFVYMEINCNNWHKAINLSEITLLTTACWLAGEASELGIQLRRILRKASN